MGARRFWHRHKTLSLEDHFHFFTLHGRLPRNTQLRKLLRLDPEYVRVCTVHPGIVLIVAQSLFPVCVFAACRSCRACSRISSWSRSRNLVRALCNCDFEFPTEQPMMPAISLCS